MSAQRTKARLVNRYLSGNRLWIESGVRCTLENCGSRQKQITTRLPSKSSLMISNPIQ
jgi:hypothetical protein